MKRRKQRIIYDGVDPINNMNSVLWEGGDELVMTLWESFSCSIRLRSQT